MYTIISFIAAVMLAMIVYQVRYNNNELMDGHDSFWMDGDCRHNKQKYDHIHTNIA